MRSTARSERGEPAKSAATVASAQTRETDGARLAGLARALDDWYTSLGRQFGPLSRPQRRMLHLLEGGAPTRVGDLAERLGLTGAGATRMLDTLETQGYVARTRMPQTDQRQVFVQLTPAGAEALRLADAVFIERVGAMARRLDADELTLLARLLRQMTGHAEHAEHAEAT